MIMQLCIKTFLFSITDLECGNLTFMQLCSWISLAVTLNFRQRNFKRHSFQTQCTSQYPTVTRLVSETKSNLSKQNKEKDTIFQRKKKLSKTCVHFHQKPPFSASESWPVAPFVPRSAGGDRTVNDEPSNKADYLYKWTPSLRQCTVLTPACWYNESWFLYPPQHLALCVER